MKYSVIAIMALALSAYSSATQTDWSGGPGYPGPVTEFSTDFSIDTDVNWVSQGSIRLRHACEYTVDDHVSFAECACNGDMDGDGDIDIVGASWYTGDIFWWANDNGTGSQWTCHSIDENFEWPQSLNLTDVDNDGDLDVVGASWVDGRIVWWENLIDSSGTWPIHTVDDQFNGAYCVTSADINGDGHIDIIGTCGYDRDVTWWNNTDGTGTVWTENIIDDQFIGRCVASDDIDGDGDKDVIGASSSSDLVSWWENIDGTGATWVEHVVSSAISGPKVVKTDDIDGDGFRDIISASFVEDYVVWWSNTDGTGTTWNIHLVEDSFEMPRSLGSADFDDDGDRDIVCGGWNEHPVSWWENSSGSGTDWIEHLIEGNSSGSSSVSVGDINGDGAPDVVASHRIDDAVVWWDLMQYSFSGAVESSILDTGEEPSWDTLEWNATGPPETSVYMQVRASNSSSNMGPWSDTLYTPCSLQGILTDGHRYVQYRAILLSEATDTTCILLDVTLNWNPLGMSEDPEGTTSALLLPFRRNPSVNTAVIHYRSGGDHPVELQVFDIAGRMVWEYSDQTGAPGLKQISVNGLPPGVYSCRLLSGGSDQISRFVLVDR